MSGHTQFPATMPEDFSSTRRIFNVDDLSMDFLPMEDVLRPNNASSPAASTDNAPVPATPATGTSIRNNTGNALKNSNTDLPSNIDAIQTSPETSDTLFSGEAVNCTVASSNGFSSAIPYDMRQSPPTPAFPAVTNDHASIMAAARARAVGTGTASQPQLGVREDGSMIRGGGVEPRFFLKRHDFMATPLIPLDELPFWMSFYGLERGMSLEQATKAAAGNPVFLDVTPRPDTIFEPNFSEEFTSYAQAAESMRTQQGLGCACSVVGSGRPQMQVTGSSDPQLVPRQEEWVQRTGAHYASLLQAQWEREGRSSTSLPAPGGADSGGSSQVYNPLTRGIFGRKLFCSHWIRTGECDFTQQGCNYLHIMPDLMTMEQLGHKSYPRWFREQPREYQLKHSQDFDPAFCQVPGYGAAIENPVVVGRGDGFYGRGGQISPRGRGGFASGPPRGGFTAGGNGTVPTGPARGVTSRGTRSNYHSASRRSGPHGRNQPGRTASSRVAATNGSSDRAPPTGPPLSRPGLNTHPGSSRADMSRIPTPDFDDPNYWRSAIENLKDDQNPALNNIAAANVASTVTSIGPATSNRPVIAGTYSYEPNLLEGPFHGPLEQTVPSTILDDDRMSDFLRINANENLAPLRPGMKRTADESGVVDITPGHMTQPQPKRFAFKWVPPDHTPRPYRPDFDAWVNSRTERTFPNSPPPHFAPSTMPPPPLPPHSLNGLRLQHDARIREQRRGTVHDPATYPLPSEPDSDEEHPFLAAHNRRLREAAMKADKEEDSALEEAAHTERMGAARQERENEKEEAAAAARQKAAPVAAELEDGELREGKAAPQGEEGEDIVLDIELDGEE